jgi:glycerate kinase
MIKYADDLGARTIMVTMGDSATMDMGIGMLHSLGAKFYTKSGVVVVPYLSNLHMITAIDTSALDSLKSRIRFVGLVDTDDYLCGELGQVRLYGRQKGLKGRDIVGVESAFLHFAEIIERHCGVNVLRVVRSTGSGGVAAALHAFLEAPLVNTLEYLSKRLELDRKITNADIAITGEGCLDNQSVLGKVPYFVASHCSGHCIGLVGRYTQAGQSDLMRACKRVSLFTLNPEIAMKEAKQALRELASSVTSLLR